MRGNVDEGKLVEQRPEEGTAAELVEKILATKNAKDAKVGSRVTEKPTHAVARDARPYRLSPTTKDAGEIRRIKKSAFGSGGST